MLIGIRGLDSCYGAIDLPGLFVVTAPSFSFAKSVLLQTVIHNPNTKTALVSFEERSRLFNVQPEINQKIFNIYDSGNLLLNVVRMRDSKDLFRKIRRNMEKEIFGAVGLILIDIDQEVFKSVTNDELSAILLIWQSWLIQHKKTCIWVVHGDMAGGFIKDKFLKSNHILNGLANIEIDVFKIKYELAFWHLCSSVQANVFLDLLFDEANNLISVAEANQLKPDIKKNTLTLSQVSNHVVVVKSEDAVHEIFPRKWEVIHSFDILDNLIIGDSGGATIIVYIDTNMDVSFLAAYVISLRRNHGGGLKIILRETEPCLRSIEEKFVINSGANLVVPYNVSFSRFIAIVYAIQGSYLIRDFPNKIEDVFQVNLNRYGKGYLTIVDFVGQVKTLVDCAEQMQIAPSLLKLSLNKAIPIDEIITQIKINRSGDIFTYTKSYLYLFLFQCEQGEIKNLLSQLFLLPIADLFLEEKLFLYGDEIRNELINISAEKYDQQETSEHFQPVINILESGKQLNRKQAISLPLSLKIN